MAAHGGNRERQAFLPVDPARAKEWPAISALATPSPERGLAWAPLGAGAALRPVLSGPTRWALMLDEADAVNVACDPSGGTSRARPQQKGADTFR